MFTKYSFCFWRWNLNNAPDWVHWKDFLIFREEQRAIGECMITANDNAKSIMGYAKFMLLTNEFIESGKNDWLNPAFSFFLNLNTEKNFRKERYFLLLKHFGEFLQTLDCHQSKEIMARINAHTQKG